MNDFEKFRGILKKYYVNEGCSFLCFGSSRRVIDPELPQKQKKFLTVIGAVAADIARGVEVSKNNFNTNSVVTGSTEKSKLLVNEEESSDNGLSDSSLRDMKIENYNEFREIVFSFFLTAIYLYLIEKRQNEFCSEFNSKLTATFPELVNQKISDANAEAYVNFF